MLVLCWQQAHLAGSKSPPGASDWYYTQLLLAFLAGKYETKRCVSPTNGNAGLASAGLLLAGICQNRLCGPLPPQLLQLRSSCRENRQPPPSSAFVQVAAGIATSLPPTCLLFCKYNVSPWEINKLTSTPERAGGFRCRGKNHLPSSYLKRLKRVKKVGSGLACISSPDGDGGCMGQVAGLAAGKSVGGRGRLPPAVCYTAGGHCQV